MSIIEIGNPVLRQVSKELTRQEILSPKIQNLILSMQKMMRDAPGVGLSAPQIDIPIQLAVIEDRKELHVYLTEQQLKDRERVPVPFHVIINPILKFDGNETVEFYEGCLSVPNLMAIVPRAKKVVVECLNEYAEPVIINANGWYARILQHEYDHLQGMLYIDKAKLETLTTRSNFEKFWLR